MSRYTLFIVISILLASVFFSCSRDKTAETPLEKNKFRRPTSYGELISFIRELDNRSEQIEKDTLGFSVEGRVIPYLKISSGKFGADRLNKLVVMIFAQQHGDEPSGKEALLALARDIALGGHEEILEHLDIILVPQVNPDGAERDVRFNADSIDLNRDHLVLEAPEVAGLREIFHLFEPYVTLDIHEYRPRSTADSDGGEYTPPDLLYGTVINPNINETMRLFAEHEYLPYATDRIIAGGYTFSIYPGKSTAENLQRITDISDGWHGFGIMNTFSLILEGRLADDLRRRTESQYHAVLTLLEFCAERKMDISSIARSARRELIASEKKDFALVMGPENDGSFTYVRQISVKERTVIPSAYIVPASEEKMITLLERHNIIMKRLNEGETFRGIHYIISGFDTAVYEGKPVSLPRINTEHVMHISGEGDVFIPTGQLGRLLLATALEPRSMHGLMQYEGFRHLRQTGRYPVIFIE